METVGRPAEQKVILHGVSWETYESLLADHGDKSAPRFAYDRGELEIVSPPPEHERLAHRISQLVLAISEVFSLEAEDFGSTAFRHEELERGSCFYVQNEERVRGKDRIDLGAGDPPPDLVIEVDLTSPSLDKLPIYARLGVPEVWRYDGERAAILRLEGTDYVEAAESLVLPPLTPAVLTRFVEGGKPKRRTAWLNEVRERARGYA